MNVLPRLLNPVAVGLLLLGLVNVAPVTAQSQKWDTTYIAEDTFFVAALNVKHLLNYEKEDSKLRKMVEEGIRDEMGIEISEIEQIQFILGGDEAVDFEGQEEELRQVKFVFSKSQEIDSVMETLFQYIDFEKAKHEGKTYFKSAESFEPCVFWPSDQMMVVANDEHLQRIMESEVSMNEFVDSLKRADGNADLFLSFNHNKLTDKMIGEVAEEMMEGLPFEMRDIASEAKHGWLTIDLADGKPITGNIVAKDEDGAERLKRAIDALVALGKTGIPFAKKEIELEENDLPDDVETRTMVQEQLKNAVKALELAESALDGTTVTAKGNNVEIKVTVMGGMADGARLIGELIGFGLMSGSSVEFEEPIIIDEIERVEPQDDAESDIEDLEFDDE